MALLSSSGSAGLDDSGIETVVSEHAEFDGYRKGIYAQGQTLRNIYGTLIRRDETLGQHELKHCYAPIDQADPSGRGRYGEHQFGLFWDDVVREQLPRLPGIEAAGDGFRFVGVDGSDVSVDDEHVRPLSEIRADPRTDARNHIERTHSAGTDTAETLLKLWDHLASVGETTTEELTGQFRRLDLEEYTGELAPLPHIEREVVSAPSPEDVTVETMADVLEGIEMFGSDGSKSPTATETWRYTR